MAINTTGNADIDTATAEIAVALRNACPVMDSDQRFYDEAMALRDAIMRGTRELDARPANTHAVAMWDTPWPRVGDNRSADQLGEDQVS